MFNNLQMLRGVAALLVFFNHSLTHFVAMGLSFTAFEWLAKYGFMGVDVFFVISGFVIAKSIDRPAENPVSPWVFVKRRFFRIYFGYWPMFLLAWLSHTFYHTDRLPNIDFLGSFSLLNVQMNSLLITPSWSLTFELLFYTLIAVCLLVGIKRKMSLMLVYIALIVLKINIFDYGSHIVFDFLFWPLILEFFAGYFLWHHRNILLKKRVVFLLLILGVAALAYGVYLSAFNAGWRVLTFGVFAFSLVVFVIWSEKIWRLSGKNWLVKLGDASYTLYLLHTITLGWFASVGLRNWFAGNNLAWPGFGAVVILTCLLSYLLYRTIEKPLYHWVINRNSKKEKHPG